MSDNRYAESMLEEVLIDAKIVTPDQLAVAKETQKNLGGTLEQVLLEKGFVKEEQLLKGLASFQEPDSMFNPNPPPAAPPPRPRRSNKYSR